MGKKFFGVGEPPTERTAEREESCPECGHDSFRYPVEGQYRMKVCLKCGWKQPHRLESGLDFETEYTEPETYNVRSRPKWRPARPDDLLRLTGRHFPGGLIVWRNHEED